jgi:hypothetical protein
MSQMKNIKGPKKSGPYNLQLLTQRYISVDYNSVLCVVNVAICCNILCFISVVICYNVLCVVSVAICFNVLFVVIVAIC